MDLLEIDGSSEALAQGLREQLLPGFGEYGLTIPQLYITNIVLPENDPNFRRIRELHTILLQTKVYQAEATVKTAQAQSETVIAAAQRQAELERQITQTEIARREAERKRIEAQAEAEALRMAGMSEAAVMRAKGYDQSDVLRAEVQKAYAAGLGQMGGSGGGALGDLAGLGVTLGAMGGVLGMTKEAVAPLFGQQTAQVPAGTWDCGCGQRGVSSNFCPNCGTRRPASGTWDCGCGLRGIFSNFCPDCGAMRPAAAWDCTCGEKGISTNFCPNCGKKKGD